MSSYFFLEAKIEAKTNEKSALFLEKLEKFADANKKTIYVLDRPLTDQKYNYTYSHALIVLSPNSRIAIIDYGANPNKFEEYVEDVIEDIVAISDKYLYKDVIGRSRKWRSILLDTKLKISNYEAIEDFFEALKLNDDEEKKKIDLLVSLFIGSINDIERVKESVPITMLDKVKQKIQLFDGDQTRFVYQKLEKKKITIQGLSGTGKTELLMHKLKDLYISDTSSSIFFTCHNKILADTLRKRIPSFFNFMKVEQQIEWQKRLWCENAWGSFSDEHSGAYRYICAFYQIPFYRYSYQMSFKKACKMAVTEIKEKYPEGQMKFAFTYMFIDESQDFDETFFELCELVTEKNIYVAGDIFQNIFDKNFSSTITPDFLLGKCYRTDPKTLMFAHALGMGLFEEIKFRWLEKKEWEDCGYNVTIEDSKYHLCREPLRRFEDLDDNFESIEIVEGEENFLEPVLKIIQIIIKENETVEPDDIGIILLDQGNDIYKFADTLEINIRKNFGWAVNKAYESKEKTLNSILISNRNNVKGLEFPFVICITRKIKSNMSYRNSLYTMLTRSFIKSYLLIPENSESGLTASMRDGLREIIRNKRMIIEEPSEAEKESIRTKFQYNLKKMSYYDIMMEIFKEKRINKIFYEKFFLMAQQADLIESDKETLAEFVEANQKFLRDK